VLVGCEKLNVAEITAFAVVDEIELRYLSKGSAYLNNGVAKSQPRAHAAPFLEVGTLQVFAPPRAAPMSLSVPIRTTIPLVLLGKRNAGCSLTILEPESDAALIY
jgi:hypothetical protein